MKRKSPSIFRVFLALATVVSLLGLAIMPAAGAAGDLFDEDHYGLGDVATISIFDLGSANAGGAGQTSAGWALTSTSGGTATLTLIEDADTGMLIGTVTFLATAVDTTGGDGTVDLAVVVKDEVEVVMGPLSDTATIVSINIAYDWYKIGDSPLITVTEQSETASVDTIMVSATSTTAGDAENIILSETGAETGTYTGSATLIEVEDTVSSGELRAASPLDTITITYGLAADTAGVDSKAPISAITSPVHQAYTGSEVVTIEGTFMDTADTTAGTVGTDVTGVARVEVSTDGGGIFTIAYLAPTGVNEGTWIYYWTAPADGSYTIISRASDAVGNVELVPEEAALNTNMITVAVDTVEPVITAAWAEREDVGTADLDNVHLGRDVELSATVEDATSGIEVDVAVTWDDTLDVWTTALTDSAVVADLDTIGGVDTSLTPEDDLIDPLVDELLAELNEEIVDLTGAELDTAANALEGTYTVEITEAGDWVALNVSTANVDEADTYTVTVVATDAAGNESDEADIAIEVVEDETDPTISATVSYQTGIQAMVGDLVTITADVTDDIAGVASVVMDEEEAEAVFGALTATELEFDYDTTVEDEWATALAVDADTVVGTYTITLTATDNADDPATAAIVEGNTDTTTVTVEVVTAYTTYQIELAEGYNLLSVPRTLLDPSLGVVFADLPVTLVQAVVGGVPMVSDYDATTVAWVGDVTALEPGIGYIVEASEAATLTVSFAAIDPLVPPPTVSLGAGWNMLGFASRTLALNMATETYLGSLVDNWVVLYDSDWNQARPGWTDDLLNIEIAQGYWIYLAEAGVLVP